MFFLNSIKCKLFRILNIRIQRDQQWLVISSLISGMIYAFSCAPIQKEIVSKLPAEYISIEALWFCFSTLIIGMIWKWCTRSTAIKNFAVLASVESFLACAVAFYLVFIRYNVWVFAISTILYSSIVSTFVGKCIMMFESILWKNKDREDFDNTSSIIRNITACAGFTIATLAMPSLKTAITLWGIGCIFDDIGWVIVYLKNRRTLVESMNDKIV